MNARKFFALMFAAAATMLLSATIYSQESDPASDTEALFQADRAWSQTAESQDWEAFFAGFADDAVVLAPDAPTAEGIDGIRKMLDALINTPGFSVKWVPTHAFVSESGELGYTFGTDVMTMDDPDGNLVTENGKYATVWRKDTDGTWKVVLDMFNSAEAAPSGGGKAEDE
jgi:ketosteroid isomerase-like protein